MTLEELAKVYCALKAVSPITEVAYRGTATSLGNLEIEDLTETILLQQRGRVRSPFTWNNMLSRLRAMIGFAVKNGWAESNHPVFIVKSLGKPVTVRMEVSETMYQEIIEHLLQFETLPNPLLRPVWFWVAVLDMFYYSGIRRRQLCHLRWSDVNLETGQVLLRASGAKNKRERLLPLHSKLVESLKQYKAKVQEVITFDSSVQLFHLRAARGKNKVKEDELALYEVSKFFSVLSKSMGIHLTAHLFRHSFATKIARNIPNIKTVQFLLNHDRVETTLAYIHPTLDDMRTLMDMPLVKQRKGKPNE